MAPLTLEQERALATLVAETAPTLGLETLETRNSDSLDFHELAVWQIKDLLRAAFIAGIKAAG